jgi:hypothetical protein
MRYAASVVSIVVLSLCAPSAARAQGSAALEGFGGLSFSGIDSTATNLGGTLSFELTPNVHVMGEAGRLGNVLPPVSDSLFSLANTGIRASAFYAEGGIRLLAAPRSNVSPYVEASAGVARLQVASDRLGSIGNAAVSAALNFVDRTGPVAGAGGGLLVRTGPVVFDVGYRYKQLFPPEPFGTILGLGQDLRSHQVRAGIGVRF